MAVMKIRMNGQLLLLRLAEMLIKIGCKMIQYNTDGLYLICKKNKLDEYHKVVKEFEEFSLLTMETDEYKAMYQLAINDYIVVPINGKVKEKGFFITETKLGKGLTPKVIPKAIQAYLLEGKPIKEFIENHTEIKDFLMSEKTGKQWTVEYNNVIQQRTNRFYASTDGAYLWKWKDSPEGKSYQNMLASSGVTILNQLDEKPISERKINYRYYLREALKIIDTLEPKQLSLFTDF